MDVTQRDVRLCFRVLLHTPVLNSKVGMPVSNRCLEPVSNAILYKTGIWRLASHRHQAPQPTDKWPLPMGPQTHQFTSHLCQSTDSAVKGISSLAVLDHVM